MKRIAAATSVLGLASTATAFTQTTPAFVSSQPIKASHVALNMGLFDGMKEAFSAPPAMSVDSERETPIDRWMGWNVKSDETQAVAADPANFVDSMDVKNYVSASLTKPMGIVFEENDEEYGGIFVISLSEDGAAEKEGTIKPGDQLVAVNDIKVSGMEFDAALGCIIDASEEQPKLTFFRGTSAQFYGPTGASADWVNEFVAGLKV
mmetsp:Transcript_10203/g.11843  ORF Transcript_10203/g.11843 Transcript_10203/m.11843 type:complete len:207 (+) Transcript_10203:181-801(+)